MTITCPRGIKIASSIIFLGTGADPYIVGKGKRSAAGIILQINDNQFHIDPGPGSLLMAKQMELNLRATTAILVSNTDIYKSNDLNVVIDAMTYSGFDKKGVLITNKSVIHGSEKNHPVITNFHRDCLERFIVLGPEKRVGINEVEIQALKTSSNESHSIGFKFYTPDFTLSYSSVTKYSAEIAEQYKNSGILILDLANPDKDNNKGLSRDDVIKIISRVSPKLVLLTGFGNKMIEADPLYEAREIQKETGVQIIAAKDGLVISPGSYSAHEGQRTFSTFSDQSKKAEIRQPEEDMPEKEPESDKSPSEIIDSSKIHPEIKEEQQKTISQTTEEEQLHNQQNNL